MNMDWNEDIVRIARAHPPQGAELAANGATGRPYVLAADLTGDGRQEIAAVYRVGREHFLMLLKMTPSGWSVAAIVKGPGYGVDAFFVAPVVTRFPGNLVVGWKVGAIWSKLSVYAWTPRGLVDAAPSDLAYSKLEVGDFPGNPEFRGRAELALWIHDTGEAYRVEVLRWDRGRFVPAPDTYPYYFGRVAAYYEALTARHPDVRIYWAYLADALAKAGRPQEALAAVDRALAIPSDYPPDEELLELKRRLTTPGIVAGGGFAATSVPDQVAGTLSHIRTAKTPRLVRTAGSVTYPDASPEQAPAISPEQAPAARPGQASAAGPELYPAPLKAIGGTRWGYIDARGAWRILPSFTHAEPFGRAGLAIAGQGGKTGAIDAAGRFVIPPVYDWIDGFREGRAIAMDQEGARVIDTAGRVLTPSPYPFIGQYSAGRALFQKQADDGRDLYGYLDRSGKEVIPATFPEANDFTLGRKAVVKIADGEYALIDVNGRRLATYKYAYVGNPGDGLLAFRRQENGPFGYIDEAGRVVIEPRFTNALAFSGGRAVVNVAPDYGSEYGLIDRAGNFIVEPKYNDILQLGENRVALGKAIDPERPFAGSTYAIADAESGRLLTDFRFRFVQNYRSSLASVSDDEHTYFIGTDGKPAQGLPRWNGSGTLTLLGSVVQANVDQRLSYYNLNLGKLVWTENTAISLTPPYVVKQHKYNPNPNYLVYYPQVEGIADRAAAERANRSLRELSGVKPVPSGQLDYSYTGDFDVTFFRNALVVLELNGYHYPWGAAHGMPSLIHANLNLKTGRIYELKDLFLPGSDYVETLNRIVGEQIRNDPQYDYVFPDTYKGIRADQPFYVTEDALHLYFEPYEIAPYAAGFPTFRVPFTEIDGIIDKQGELWQAFH